MVQGMEECRYLVDRPVDDNTDFKGYRTSCAMGYFRPPVFTPSMKIAFFCLPVSSYLSSIITLIPSFSLGAQRS